jgi:hypothetical protein
LSPILVRPVREQLEHDRIIRFLHAKFRRRHEAVMNPGNEQNAGIGAGTSTLYPDLLLMSQERGHKLQVIVEIETGESVNHLEALAQWAHFGRTRAAFHLYVPAGMVDVARRLSEDSQIYVSEIWSYHIVGDQPRFTLVHRNREAPPPPPKPKPAPKPTPEPVTAKPVLPDTKPVSKSKPKAKPKPKPKPRPKPKPKKAVKKQKR